MTRPTQSANPLAAAFSPLKPLLVLSLVGIAALAVTVGVFSNRQVTPRNTSIKFAPEDSLVPEKQYEVREWTRDIPEAYQRPGVQLYHVISFGLKDGANLRRPATLTFPAPFTSDLDLTKTVVVDRPGSWQVGEWVQEARIWSPRPARFSLRPEAFAETTIKDSGTYALLKITGNQTEKPLEPNPVEQPKDEPKPDLSKQALPDPSKFRFAPLYWTNGTAPVEIDGLRLCIHPSADELRHDDVPTIRAWGTPPGKFSEFNATQSARWYLTEELAEMDLPEEVRLMSDPDALVFRFPSHLQPGQYTVVLRIVDLLDPDRPGVVAEGRIPLAIKGD